ncbi:MAG: hypothetical protein NUV82_01435 [Candidatus Komeilibacteria bacterium]|nr:hypothetical protein [Candidatus Komeilibacteria bacterium]
MAKKANVEIVIFSVVLVVLLISLFVYFFLKNENNLSENRLTSVESDKRSKLPSVSPSRPPGPTSVPYTLPSGPQTYRFSHGSNVTGPKIQTMIINPLDPKKGTIQTVTLAINSESPVTKASIIVYSDSQEKNVNLKLISGDFLKGTYQGSWEVNDTYNNKYALRYILKAEKNTFDNVSYFR